ncbi:MAG TPA: hypothetical protein DIW86_10755, partial [Pseudomonas sp.]|nr:hypothetical protein [Pseudomonas sp.]
ALVPLSQAVMLDINEPKDHGRAMAVWGMGVMLGPILGPTLGGWLTDNLDWRWVFFINLPIGILAFAGVFLFLSEKRSAERKRFDVLGFASLALAIGGFQMMLDRGPSQDWFASSEIWVYLIVGIISLWIFGVQLATAKKPFVDRGLLADTNFVTCCIFGFFIGILLYSVLALLPPMMQNLLGYPVAFTGLVSMPRGVGSFIAMFAVGQLIGRVSIKLILLAGLTISAVSLYQMTHFTLGMDTHLIIVSGFNVYPNEIEDVVMAHPAVANCAVIGVPDERTGEAVKLFVVARTQGVSLEELKAYCKANFTGYKVPKHIVLRESLPMTPVGKILRRELRDIA